LGRTRPARPEESSELGSDSLMTSAAPEAPFSQLGAYSHADPVRGKSVDFVRCPDAHVVSALQGQGLRRDLRLLARREKTNGVTATGTPDF
jgi:hypothetical protein